MGNKRKWYSILLVGLALLIASSVMACATPATEPEPEPPAEAPPTEQPTPTTYTLSVSVSPSGAGSVSPSSGEYAEGTQVTLTAVPASGYTFDYWDGDASGSSATITVIMDSDKSVTAHFKEKEVATYSLSASVQPSGSGSVAPSSGDYLAGTDVTLVATAAPGYKFDHWSGDASGTLPTITITMDSDKSTIAHFADTTPPVISGVDISRITESSVTVKWETDEAATSHVEYGKTTDYGLTATLDKALATSHSVTLTELKPETTYHFRIKSVDETGNEALSKDHNFTTKTTEELLSAMLYPAMTIGSYVHQLSFNLFNGSSQAITVTKVEIFDEHGDVAFTMSKSDIAETWGSGKVKPGNSLSASISFQIPPSTKEIEDWRVKWYCLDANGVEFTVEGKSKAL